MGWEWISFLSCYVMVWRSYVMWCHATLCDVMHHFNMIGFSLLLQIPLHGMFYHEVSFIVMSCHVPHGWCFYVIWCRVLMFSCHIKYPRSRFMSYHTHHTLIQIQYLCHVICCHIISSSYPIFLIDIFQKLFRQDLLVASLFRNFLLATRIMHTMGCQPVSIPALPLTHKHMMWLSWDAIVEQYWLQLEKFLKHGIKFQHVHFFTEHLTGEWWFKWYHVISCHVLSCHGVCSHVMSCDVM